MTGNTDDMKSWPDMPLPDEGLAWQKMERLLEKKRRRPVLWLWFAGAVLLAVIGGGMWWQGKDNSKPLTSTEPAPAVKQTTPPVTVSNETSTTKTTGADTAGTNKSTTVVVNKNANALVNGNAVSSTNKRAQAIEEKYTAVDKQPVKQKAKQLTTDTASARQKAAQQKQQNVAGISDKSGPVTTNNASVILPLGSGNKAQPNKPAGSDSVTTAKTDIAKPDSIQQKATAPTATDSASKKAKQKAAFILTAGVGLQQPIAVANQQPTAYTYLGKKGSLSDYIPSLYIAAQRGRWLLQAEAMYAVPQPVSPFQFSRRTTYNAAQTTLGTEAFSIQKMYYHQLPLSINYVIKGGFSVGVGGQYNILSGAVTERSLTEKNVVTNAESLAKNTVPVKGYTDSFLYRTTTSLLLQTAYSWKRFSVGLRYTKNLQPFIKYTTPGGDVMAGKNETLQAIIRFRLWTKEVNRKK